jgi:hypothetical protein
VLGYHPLLATIAGTGEILHGRLRKGSANTQRGTKRFVNELVARARRDNPDRELTVRFDSGFWNNDTMTNLTRLDVRFTMAVRTNVDAVQATIGTIPESAWQSIDYTCDGEAEVAECAYTSGQGAKRVIRRMIVRRTRLTDKSQQKLWPDWRHHAFLTDLDGDVVDIDRFHREHAVVELAIKDLKAGARSRASPLGCVLGELGVVPDRDPCPQRVPLDDSPRRPRHRPADRRAHHPHPTPRVARTSRQPGRTADLAAPVTMAMGQHVHRHPRRTPHDPTRPDLTPGHAVRRAAEPTERHQHRPAETGFATPHRPPDSSQAAPAARATLTSRSPMPSRWIEAKAALNNRQGLASTVAACGTTCPTP